MSVIMVTILASDNYNLSIQDILGETSGAADIFGFDAGYGYIWVGFNLSEHFGVTKDYIWCGAGLFEQTLCLDYETKRVVVVQRSNMLYNRENEGLIDALIAEAFSSDITWEGTLAPTEAPPTLWGWFDWLPLEVVSCQRIEILTRVCVDSNFR